MVILKQRLKAKLKGRLTPALIMREAGNGIE